MLVNSVPLSETIVPGLPPSDMTQPSSRVTRSPDSDVSATNARFSRVWSSTTARIRNLRPSVSASDTTSKLQRWFGPSGHHHRPSCAQSPLSTTSAAHLERLFAIDPTELLVFHLPDLPFHHHRLWV